MATPFISAHGVDKVYGEGAQRTVALKPVDFALEPGELVMLAGPSGSGKSTLLAILSGLLTPTSGRVAAMGRDYQSFSAHELDEFRLAHFGFIFQGFHLLPALSALEQVSIVLQRQGGVGGHRQTMPPELAAQMDEVWVEMVAPKLGFEDYAAFEAALRAGRT